MKKQTTSERTTRSKVAKRASKQNARIASAKRRSRPLHVHIALHPINIFTLLCVGVLLVAFTLNAMADSYTVSAVVAAPPLTEGAVISFPKNGMQTSSQAMTVTGTCPDNSYENLMDNGTFAGTDNCKSGAFSIGLDLTPGTNQLQAQAYNITNAPGPVSPTVTVTYIPPTPPPTNVPPTNTTTPTVVATPKDLTVAKVDRSVIFVKDTVQAISNKPTMSGTAPSFSKIVIAVQATSDSCTTYATVVGFWSCTFRSAIPAGKHTVNITATPPNGGKPLHFSFGVDVLGSSSALPSSTTPFRLVSSYTYSVHNVGQAVPYSIRINGGAAPFVVTVLWGDGAHTTITRQNGAAFTVSHTYGWFNAATTTKTVKVQGVDSAGESSTLQLTARLRNPAFHSAIANITRSTGLWGFFSAIRPWLWVLWPGYLIVMLLVLAFWLGEREELEKLKVQKRLLAGHKHAHR